MAGANLTVVIQLKDLITNQLRIINSSLQSLAKAGFAAVGSAVSHLGTRLEALKRSLFSLKGILLALGMRSLIKSFLDAGNKAESLRVRLSTLAGSVKEGNRLFNDMAKLASQVPQTFEEIIEASTRLIGVVQGGVNDVNKLMPLILDLSTATGLAVNDVTAQVIRMWSAGAAAADMFRERGVLAMLGFKAATDYNVLKTRKMLMEAWEGPTSKFRDASKSLATTFSGLVSMLKDAWFQFRIAVMDTGVLDFLKGLFGTFLDDVRALKADTKAYESVVASTARFIIMSLKAMIYAVAALLDTLRGVKLIVTELGWLWSEFVLIGTQVWKGLKLIWEGAELGFLQLSAIINDLIKTVSWGMGVVIDKMAEGIIAIRDFATAANALSDKFDLVPDAAIQSLSEMAIKVTKLSTKFKEFGGDTSNVWEDLAFKQGLALEQLAFGETDIEKFWYENKESLSAYIAELSTTLPAVQKVADLFERVDEKMMALSQARLKAEQDIKRRQEQLKPEPFAFTEAEEQARAASLGVLELREEVLRLDKQYKDGAVTVEEYFAKRRAIQQREYSLEMAAKLAELDKINKAEIDRVEATQDEISTIKKDIALGTRSADDVVTKNMLANLEVQKSASREYLESVQKNAEEMYKLRLDYEEDLLRQETEMMEARKRKNKEYIDFLQDMVDDQKDASLGVASEIAAFQAQMAINEEQRQIKLQERLDQINKDASLSTVRANELRNQAIALANAGFVHDQVKLFSMIADASQEAAGNAASAFKDLYDATGQKSKEFFYAWKAMQIAETIINTYSAAQKAYTAYAGISYVGPALGAIAATLAVAQGMARVAMIRSQTLAAGGEVGGFSANDKADNIPALLTAGEFVHPVKTVRHYGLEAMEAIRKRAVPRDILSHYAGGRIGPAPASMRFAAGGPVVGSKDAEKIGGGEVNITNVIDPQVMEQYVASRPGEKTILNVITKNQFQLKQILNQ